MAKAPPRGPTPGNAYSVSEADPGPNFVLTSATCDDGSDPSAIDLGPSETVTRTFTNTLQLGAIKIHKDRKHAADGPGDHPHSGVAFTVNGTSVGTTDANGDLCVDGLLFGTYTVHEVTPAGYQGEADKSVTVDNVAFCTDIPYVGETVSFHNTPLTNLSVSVDSQVPVEPVPPSTALSPPQGSGDDITASANDRRRVPTPAPSSSIPDGLTRGPAGVPASVGRSSHPTENSGSGLSNQKWSDFAPEMAVNNERTWRPVFIVSPASER